MLFMKMNPGTKDLAQFFQLNGRTPERQGLRMSLAKVGVTVFLDVRDAKLNGRRLVARGSYCLIGANLDGS